MDKNLAGWKPHKTKNPLRKRLRNLCLYLPDGRKILQGMLEGTGRDMRLQDSILIHILQDTLTFQQVNVAKFYKYLWVLAMYEEV